MSDPLLDFVLSRDPEKVLAEARPASLEVLYAEASMEDRAALDLLPIGVLRRRIAHAEAVNARKVKVFGNRELLTALKRSNAERDSLKARNQELRRILEDRAA